MSNKPTWIETKSVDFNLILLRFVSFLNISESIRELIWDVGSANINISSVQDYRPGRHRGCPRNVFSVLGPPSPGLRRVSWASRGQDQPEAQPGDEGHLRWSESFRLRGCSRAAGSRSHSSQIYNFSFQTAGTSHQPLVASHISDVKCHPENYIRFSL